MRHIQKHRTILGVDEKATLSDLKSVYRNFMKQYHPDRIQETEEAKKEAEEKSKKIIESYHFLVSVSPETRDATILEYTETITKAGIQDFEYKSEVLRIVFTDGNEYEYFGVPKAIYVKLVNAEPQTRFARRHIYSAYTYRSLSKIVAGN